MTTATAQPTSTESRASARLGEELPVFCERCGYILHGMPMVRCERCDVLQFHCPECGYHQPINTLRPAFQRMLGRLRAVWLAWVVLFKLNYFGWLGFAWFAGGYEWSHSYNYRQFGGNWQNHIGQYQLQTEDLLGMMILGLLFGAVGRMLLLRWRAGWIVGLAMGGLVAGLMFAGAQFMVWERELMTFSPFNASFISLTVLTALAVCIGAAVVWWIWVGVVHLFLPARLAGSLLDWQRAMATPRVSGLARE